MLKIAHKKRFLGIATMSLKKIMSATPAEFFRSLTHLEPDEAFDQNSTRFRIPQEMGDAFISYTILPKRQVTGLLSLPQMEVLLEFSGMSEEAQAKFIDDFDLAFRRGGG